MASAINSTVIITAKMLQKKYLSNWVNKNVRDVSCFLGMDGNRWHSSFIDMTVSHGYYATYTRSLSDIQCNAIQCNRPVRKGEVLEFPLFNLLLQKICRSQRYQGNGIWFQTILCTQTTRKDKGTMTMFPLINTPTPRDGHMALVCNPAAKSCVLACIW